MRPTILPDLRPRARPFGAGVAPPAMPTREISYVKCVMRVKITVRCEDGNGVGGEICGDYVGKRPSFGAWCPALGHEERSSVRALLEASLASGGVAIGHLR